MACTMVELARLVYGENENENMRIATGIIDAKKPQGSVWRRKKA
uniref:Uncharacterized protein n=1 Tax=Parascaris univalens TaxID=6257 RepID=A0A915CK90_PARUN